MKKISLIYILATILLFGNLSAQTLNWQQLSGLNGGFPQQLFEHNQQLWGITGSGFLYRFSDENIQWEKINQFIVPDQLVYLKAFDSNDDFLFAGIWNHNDYGGMGIYRSSDHGISWQQAGLNNELLSAISVKENTVLAGTYHAGIFISTNHGDSWNPVAKLRDLTTAISELFIGDGYILAADVYGIMRSTNWGQTWQNTNLVGIVNSKIISNPKRNELCVWKNDSLFVSPDKGMNWTPRGQQIWYSNSMTVDTLTGDIYLGKYFYYANGGGVFKSTDGGLNWTYSGLSYAESITALSWVNGHLYAGTGIGLSQKNASQIPEADTLWSIYNTGFADASVQTIHKNGNELFAGVNGLKKSLDIINLATSNLTHVKLVEDENRVPTKLVSVGDTFFAAVYYNGLYKSVDRGISWSKINHPFDFNEIHDMKIYDDVLYMGAYSSGIEMSDDYGATWREFPNPNNIILVGLSFYSSTDTVYAGMANGLYRSTDKGFSWQRISDNVSRGIYAIESVNNTLLVSSDFGGVHQYSTTHGWVDLIYNEFGYFFKNTTVISMEKRGHDIYAATTNMGVYKTSDIGLTWNYLGLSGIPINQLLFSGDTLFAATGNSGILYSVIEVSTPVEMTGLEADFKGDINSLSWTAVSETNNYGFEIQRRIDENDWKSVTFIDGRGTVSYPKKYSFQDVLSSADKNYSVIEYRLKQVDLNGNFIYSNILRHESGKKLSFQLNDNYPNPFNPATTITYTIPTSAKVKILVYDMTGKLISTPENTFREKGSHSVSFNAGSLSSGIYYYHLESGKFSQTKKMILMK